MQKYGLTRTDYLQYKDYFFRMLENVGIENETSEKQSVNQRHDKSFKDILKNTTEMSKFLEQFMGIEVSEQNLEEQKNSYINKMFEKRESDIVYKIKDKDIYVLVEHQSKVDNRIPRRIFEYCMELMLSIEKSRKDMNSENPIIIPIVIYTGTEKWTVKTRFSDTQKNYKGYEEYKINLNYKLIDVNKYVKSELKKNNTKFSYMMIFEKCDTEELVEEIIDLILLAKGTGANELLSWVKQQIQYVFPETLGENKDKILKILEMGEKSDMEDLIERIKYNDRKKAERLINKGISQAITQIIKNMIMQKQDDETIMRFTNVRKEDIEKVKRELQTEI